VGQLSVSHLVAYSREYVDTPRRTKSNSPFSLYALVVAMVGVVVALMYPGMLLLWLLSSVSGAPFFYDSERADGSLWVQSRNALDDSAALSLLISISTVIIIWNACCQPSCSVPLSGLVIVSHAFLRDLKKYIESSASNRFGKELMIVEQ
jgi:hypothetical protein